MSNRVRSKINTSAMTAALESLESLETVAPPVPLSQRPDWLYMLNEFSRIYRLFSAGGSKPIRGHMREVRERISRCITVDPPLVQPPPATKPVCAHLGRALDNGEHGPMSSMIKTIEKIRGDLVWLHGYEAIPRVLSNQFAFAEIAGPRGPVVFPDMILGLVLFAPGTTYPQHHHKGITETYVCLSGAVSQNHDGVYAPGSIIFNPPESEHEITTSDREPVLLCYAWSGTAEAIAHQEMAFTKKPRRKRASSAAVA